jgi:hypothetical protein
VSNVGDRKNVQNVIWAPDSTPVITASAGSTGSGVGATDAAALADAPLDADAAPDCVGVGVFVWPLGDGDADELQATNSRAVAMPIVRVRLSFTG